MTAEEHAVVTTVPGEQYEYSNLGYGVLDEVVAVVSGMSAGTFVQREIFDVLGMQSATIGPGYAGAAPAHAERYGTDGTPYPSYDVEHRGASLAWATAGDVVRFGLSHCDGGLLAGLPEVRKQQEPPSHGPAVGYAWRIAAPGGVRLLSHSGGMGGVASLILVCPSLGLVVATMVNESYSTVARRVGYMAMSRLLTGATGHAIDALPRAEEAAAPPPVAGARGHWAGEAVIDGERRAVELKVRSTGEALIGRGSDLAAALLRPAQGHDLCVAAEWSMTGTPRRETNATCLDLLRTANGFAGKVAITDLPGGGFGEIDTDGGGQELRQASYVTYPIVLTAVRS